MRLSDVGDVAAATKRSPLSSVCLSWVFACTTAAAWTGCGGSGPEAAPSAAPTASAHGSADAVPGSHADWCGEHAVPESQCTRCDASLVPAFQATGDWCPEHGLPESQCLQCNPELKIERPPKEG